MSERGAGIFSAVERLVALRYLRSRRQGRALSFTALVSLVGIGTVVLWRHRADAPARAALVSG